MLYNRLNIYMPLSYESTGKFHAPSARWIHEKRKMRNFELVLMVSGVWYIEIGGKRYAAGPNQYVLIQPSDLQNQHSYTVMEGYKPSGCTYYWLHFTCDNHSFYQPSETDFIPTDHNVYLPTLSTLSNPARVTQYLRQLQDCTRAPYRNFIDYANYLTTLIVSEIYHQFLDSYYAPSAKGRPEPPAYVSGHRRHKSLQLYNDLTDYIHFNLSKDIKAGVIASQLGYSEKYLSLICKANTGYTLKQYIQNQRIERANFLLLDTNLTIGAVGAEVGFSGSQNFSRAYKAIMGVSPLEYRNTYAKKINN